MEPEPSFTLVPHEPLASFKKEEEQIEIVNAKNEAVSYQVRRFFYFYKIIDNNIIFILESL
ncbi:MAG: hypothetical protein WKF59_02595 [Chitinophagaceae bacterium]